MKIFRRKIYCVITAPACVITWLCTDSPLPDCYIVLLITSKHPTHSNTGTVTVAELSCTHSFPHNDPMHGFGDECVQYYSQPQSCTHVLISWEVRCNQFDCVTVLAERVRTVVTWITQAEHCTVPCIGPTGPVNENGACEDCSKLDMEIVLIFNELFFLAGSTAIKMPALSPTMTQGTIQKWYKQEGNVGLFSPRTQKSGIILGMGSANERLCYNVQFANSIGWDTDSTLI